MSSIAIITARGGSKRIPKKNIKEFCGKPIIAYSIKAALESNLFDEVMVSTDDSKIAEIAKQYGANVPFMRSKKTSSDFATTAEVICEVILKYRETGKNYDKVCCIYPTAPFVTAVRLKDAMKKLTTQHAECIMTVVRFSFPPQRAYIIRDGILAYQFPENEKKRSQDLEPLYHDCGQFYICSVEELLKYQSMVLPNAIPYIMPEEEVQDIDTESDWNIAEMKYRVLNRL